MPRVSVRTPQMAKPVALPEAYSGSARAQAYFDGPAHPLHLYMIEIGRGETVHIATRAMDQLAYIWRGEVQAGGHRLAAGSSLIVEHGSALELVGTDAGAVVLAFSSAQSPPEPRRGGHVHLLPAHCVPRTDSLGGMSGLGGAMHADSDCATCELWLHENHFAGSDASRNDAEGGIHSHSEDEIIFVIDGEIRLGARLFGPGTALAIAADTLYSFTPGPSGLHFVNFRAAKPGDIRFRNSLAINEPLYWREKLPRPAYLSPQD